MVLNKKINICKDSTNFDDLNKNDQNFRTIEWFLFKINTRQFFNKS